MKKMTSEQMRIAMIEIILGKQPSILKMRYPEHYRKLYKEIVDTQSSGRMVKIPL